MVGVWGFGGALDWWVVACLLVHWSAFGVVVASLVGSWVCRAEIVLAFGFDLSSVGGFAWAFHAVALLRSSTSCVLSEVGVSA